MIAAQNPHTQTFGQFDPEASQLALDEEQEAR